MKNKSILTSLFTAAMVITGISSWADSPQRQKIIPLQYTEISKSAVSAGVGYFLLLRTNNLSCAIRFTDYKIVSGGYPVSYSGDYSYNNTYSEGNARFESRSYAEYDYFYQNDYSSDFKKSGVKIGHEKLAGIGWFWNPMNQDAPTVVKCGSLMLQIQTPVAVTFFEGVEPRDQGIELAPTKWQDINEINLNDPRVKWYRYDKTRQNIRIPVEDLW
jgi:hypothetical protein